MLKGYTLNRKPATLCIQVIQFPFMWNGSLAFPRCNGILLLVKKRDYQCARIYLLVGLLERHTIVYPSTDILRQWFQRPRKHNVAVAYAGGKPQGIVPLLSLLLQCLEKKGLISLDFAEKIRGFDDSAYAAYPIRGSMALTQRGQQVLEMMEGQGIGEEI